MKDDYRLLCESEPSIQLFSQAWWLDAVAGEDWDVVLCSRGEQFVGAIPFVRRKRFGYSILSQPPLTQTLGPWIKPSKKGYSKRLSFEKDILGELADNLPNYDSYIQNWHCHNENWLPFYWRGFTQTTRYTYRLSNLNDKDQLWAGLQPNIRGHIRKAKERFNIVIRPAESIDEYLALNKMTFERQGMTQPYTDKFVHNLDAAAVSRNARDCLVAVDENGRLHAGVYIVRHGDTAYYLMGGGDPDVRNSGATSLVLWEAICQQPPEIDTFDFEGSMIEPIESFFRGFGATLTPYFQVSHAPSKTFALLSWVRSQLPK